MPTTCVAFTCNNISNLEKGIALHIIPLFGDDCAEASKRRKKGLIISKRHMCIGSRQNHSAVCSENFKPVDFKRYFSALPGAHFKPRLTKDELGVSIFPTVHASSIVAQKTKSNRSTRKMRKVRLITSLSFAIMCHFPFEC